MFFKNNKTVTVFKCRFIIRNKNTAKQLLRKFSILFINFNYIKRRNGSCWFMIRSHYYRSVDLVQQEEVSLTFFIVVQQVYGLKPFHKIINYIIIQEWLQNIFQCRTEIFFYINNIREYRGLVIPSLVVVQKFHTFRISFHGIN